VPVERIELPIPRLQGECITIVLHRLQMHCLAYREGFEPSQAGLEAAVLPLTLPILVLAIRSGLEPLASTVTGWRSNQLN